LQNDLVNEVFPPVSTKFKPEFTDFNYWRSNIPDITLPDLSPPSPALSARSDSSSRYSVLGKITGLGRRGSRQPILPVSDPSSRPSSPLIGPSLTSDELSEPNSRSSSMPGSYEDKGSHFPASMADNYDLEANEEGHDEDGTDDYDYDAEEDNFDDDLLATGEMRNVPF
jgi:phosphatidate phosphatase LPIN